MTKVDIISGFLGAGKTTLIRKLIKEGYGDKKIILIENEFGEIGVDTGFLKDTGVTINEMTAGCICCTLVGDFAKALNQVMEEYNPDVIVIEPSGVGKLSDVIIAVQDIDNKNLLLNSFATVVDAKKAKKYLKNFGEFFKNQVENASCIILSHTADMTEEKIDEVVKVMRGLNHAATLVTTDWKELSGADLLSAMEQKNSLNAELEKLREEAYRELEEHEHHHHDHEHHHDEHEHHHHHHEHDDNHEHHHEHDNHHDHEHCHDEVCSCGHHHHHGHDADEVFSTIGMETAHTFNKEQLERILDEIEDEDRYGMVLRAKGIVQGEDGEWIHFDYVTGEGDVRNGSPEVTGMLCVIGVDLKEKELRELFGVEA